MYCHVGTLFQFNVYSYPSLIKVLFIMCTSCFMFMFYAFMGRLKF